jgi:hypothetical protein
LLSLLLVMLIISTNRHFKLRKTFSKTRVKITREQFRRFLLYGFAGAVIVSALFTANISVPSLCANCHTIKKPFDQWRHSSHKHISCVGCHYESGLYGYVQGSIRGTENLVAHVFKAPAPMQSLIPNKTCLNCHHEINDKILTSDRRVKVKHKEITNAGFPCTDCHNTTAHSAKNEKSFSMSICVKCHNRVGASAKCSSCHLEDIAYKPHVTLDDWPKTKAARIICTGCHSKKTDQRCILCHEIELPHSNKFRKTHSERAIANTSLCYKCHWSTMKKDNACSCHKDGNVHGSYVRWYFKHRETARINGIGCNCHSRSYCSHCHDDPNTIYPSTFSGTLGGGLK